MLQSQSSRDDVIADRNEESPIISNLDFLIHMLHKRKIYADLF